MFPSPMNTYTASRRLDASLRRHAQLLKADQSPEDKDRRPGHVNIGEGGAEWNATVSGDKNGGSYSFTQPFDKDPSDTVTFTDHSLVKMGTYRGYDGKMYMTTSHIDRANIENSQEVTRVVDPNSIYFPTP